MWGRKARKDSLQFSVVGFQLKNAKIQDAK
jgi:hypothetical protein